MAHSVGEAAARASAKGMAKKEEKVITNTEKIRHIRLNIEAGLMTTNFYIQGLLEEYDVLLAVVSQKQVMDAETLKKLNDPDTWKGINESSEALPTPNS